MSNEREATLGPCDACQPSAKDAKVAQFIPNCPRCHGTGKERIVQIQVVETSMFALTSNGRVFRHKDAYSI